MERALNILVGDFVTIYCAKYIYAGVLRVVHEGSIVLDPAWIVYNTGNHGVKEFAVAKPMPKGWIINVDAIESFGEFKTIEVMSD